MTQSAALWQKLMALGERLLTLPTLEQEHETIVSVVGRLLEGEASLWLDAAHFTLPGLNFPARYAETPPADLMQQALTARRTVRRCPGPDGRYWLATPLEYQQGILGILQIVRAAPYREEDVDFTKAIASVISMALTASHRFALERWRIEQLQLVRRVALQVANVLDVDELADRVTTLIQETFGYYYVAIFTLDEDKNLLRFRSNAAKAREIASPIETVQLGKGLIGRAAREGQEIVASDVRADARYCHMEGLPETLSEVALPLKIEHRVVGVLDVQSDRLDAFHPNDLLVLQALADNIARAIDAARLYTNLRRRAEQLSVVAGVSKRLTANLDLQRLMQDAADLLHTHFGYPYVHLYTVHWNRRQIIYRAGSGARSRAITGEYALSLDAEKGILPWVARHGETVLLNDVNTDARYLPTTMPPEETASELCVPLVFNERVMGILDIQSDQFDAFADDDRMLAESIGDTLAVAIRNADLYRSEQWRRQVADSLREVAVLLSEDATLEQVLDTSLLELERTLPSDASAIWLLDDEGALYVGAAHGVDVDALERTRRGAPKAAAQLLRAFLDDMPRLRAPDDPLGPLALTLGFQQNYSAIAAPLKIGDRPLGVLTLAHHLPGRYGHEARAVTTTFAGYAAVAIENARLYDRAQEQAYASSALLQVAQAVASLSSLREILMRVVRSLPILIGARRVALFEWDETTKAYRFLQDYGLSETMRRRFSTARFQPQDFPLLDVARRQNALAFASLPDDSAPDWTRLTPVLADDASNWLEKQRGAPLLLAFPLAIKNEIFGVMLIEDSRGPRRFRARRVEILSGVAQQLGMAMQNDRLQTEMVLRERLQTEAALAREIQQNFIPQRLPDVPGLDIAAEWKTARQVGGDFYDAFLLPDGRVLFFIADVADKGMPAALFMVLTRKLVRVVAGNAPGPAEVLRRVNALIYPDCRRGMFVTAVCAVYAPQTGELTYANAGHNPPLLLRADGGVSRLTRTGMALGVLEDAAYTEERLRLQTRDRLFFYTDGLTEIFSAEGEMFGEERLVSCLQGLEGGAAAQVRHLVGAALDFGGPDEMRDDVTVLLLYKQLQNSLAKK